jgi:hypothetical protein
MRRVVQKNSPIYGGNLRNVGLSPTIQLDERGKPTREADQNTTDESRLEDRLDLV